MGQIEKKKQCKFSGDFSNSLILLLFKLLVKQVWPILNIF